MQYSTDRFFESEAPPEGLADQLEKVQEFVQRNIDRGRRVVLITSGGTTVPLEHNVVRFLDNFSAGTRGSSSAEYFLRTGEYAVIFMHRQHSLQPFFRHYSHSTNPFLDLLQVVGDAVPEAESADDTHLFPRIPQMHPTTPPPPKASPETQQIRIPPPHLDPMLALLKAYKKVRTLDLLHSLTFTTVAEYLWLLRGISRIMGATRDSKGELLGRRGMYYLAAAVSDFFIPSERMSEHKIQSGKGSLVIEMDQVPKVLKDVVSEWSNDGFVVSFKLETDSALLIPKSKVALERYGHQLVIGNLLQTRKHEVVFVEKDSEYWVRIPENTAVEDEIEEEIVARLVEVHTHWIEK